MKTIIKAFLDDNVEDTRDLMEFIAMVLHQSGNPQLTMAQNLIVSREVHKAMLMGATAVCRANRRHINTDELADATEDDYNAWAQTQNNIKFDELPKSTPVHSKS